MTKFDDGYRPSDDLMREKDGGPKQDWENGVLSRVFGRQDTPFEKAVRYICTAGMLAVVVAYWYFTR
jgi:hypothetical protein